MRGSVGSIHLEVKSYLVEPLSLNGFSPHASPRAATHTRHARTNKELVSLAMHESQAQKNPGNLAATGARRLEVELKLCERRPSVLTEPRGNFAETDWLPALILDHIDDDAAHAVSHAGQVGGHPQRRQLLDVHRQPAIPRGRRGVRCLRGSAGRHRQ